MVELFNAMNDIIKKIIELQYKYTETLDFEDNEEMNLVMDSISFIALIIDLEKEYKVELNDAFLSYPIISIQQLANAIQKEIGVNDE